jgi:hypothetical protein
VIGGSLWLLALLLVGGWPVAAALGHAHQGAHRLVAVVAWAPALGVGLVSVGYFLSGYLGTGRGAVPLAVTASLAVALRLGCPVGAAAVTPVELPLMFGGERRWRVVFAALMLVLVCLGAWNLHRWASHRFHGSADAVNIWNARALLLVHAEQEDLPELFAGAERGHRDYPLMVPAAVAAGASWLALPVEAAGRAVGLACLVGMICAVYLGVAGRAGTTLGLAAACLVLSTPAVHRWAFAQVADVPMAYLVVLSCCGLMALAEGRPAPPPLALGVVAGLMPWMKNEGIPLLIAFAAALAVAAVASRRFIAAGVVATGLLPGLLVTTLFKLSWPSGGGNPRFPFAAGGFFDVERWRLIGGEVARHLLALPPDPAWGVTWHATALLLLLAVAMGLSRRARAGPRGQPAAAVAAAVFLGLGATAYVTAYLLVRGLAWHLDRTLDRVPIHLLPALVVAILASPGRERSDDASPTARRVNPRSRARAAVE